jgi:trans-2,3-dihydro-3-hydroxyanthranilate isomerase
MRYKYFICDVFTPNRFGGNQLAVLPHAKGLSDTQMQQIAKEFNFPESTFIFPAKKGNTREVRIFNPTMEMPFAGHPNIGTAFVLENIGELGEIDDAFQIVFEEKAGLVPITLSKDSQGEIFCELKGPEELSLGDDLSVDLVASALSISPNDIVVDCHVPHIASVGMPFVMVELKNHDVLKKIKVNLTEFETIASQGISPFVHSYIRSNDEFDIKARMFAPLQGIPEDPATGSANCALAGLLAYYDTKSSGLFEWTVSQGVEISRPSFLKVRAEKKDDKVLNTWVGGQSVMVSEGVIFVD